MLIPGISAYVSSARKHSPLEVVTRDRTYRGNGPQVPSALNADDLCLAILIYIYIIIYIYIHNLLDGWETPSSSLALDFIRNIWRIWIPQTLRIAPSIHHWIGNPRTSPTSQMLIISKLDAPKEPWYHPFHVTRSIICSNTLTMSAIGPNGWRRFQCPT